MRGLAEKPQMVKDATAAKKGMFWLLEILVFVVVLIVSNVAMLLIQLPVTLAMLFSDRGFVKAVVDGDRMATYLIGAKIASSDICMLTMLGSEILMIVVVCLFCKLLQKRKMSTLGFCKKGMVKEYLIGALAGFVVFSVALWGAVALGALDMPFFSFNFSVGLFLLYLVGFMIQGMAEEVLCRSYFMVSVARRYPLWLAVVLNATVFALLHLGNGGLSVLSIINLILFGIFASFYFVRRGNIWGIGAFHSVWNWIQGCFYGVRVSGMDMSNSLFTTHTGRSADWLSGGDFGLEGSIFVTIVFVIGIVILYRMKPAEQVTVNGEA